MPSSWASSVSSSRPPPATSARQPVGQPGALGRLARDPGQHGVGVRRARRAAQQHRVARLQAQRGGVDRHVRPRLVDDGDHAERDSNLAELEPVGQPAAVDDLADRVRQRRDRARAVGDPADARLVQRQPVHQSGGETRRAAGLEIARVGLQDLRDPRLERVGDREQRRVLRGRWHRREPPRRGLGGEREIGHGGSRSGDGCGHGGSLGFRESMTTILRARVAHTPRDPFREDGALETFDDGAVAFDGGTILATGPFATVSARPPGSRGPSTAATACCCPGSSTPTSTSRRSP